MASRVRARKPSVKREMRAALRRDFRNNEDPSSGPSGHLLPEGEGLRPSVSAETCRGRVRDPDFRNQPAFTASQSPASRPTPSLQSSGHTSPQQKAEASGKLRHLSRARDTQTVTYTHLRAHETPEHLVCRLLLEKKNIVC